jgi:Core-2/I-Branching enzyme
MTSKIGFVILSHSNARQLLRLVLCLRRIYDNPPIAVHHDFHQCPLETQDFPFEVKFVTPGIATGWGNFSLVMATLRALKLLYDHATPEWFVLLSASDYPVMSADKVLEDLSSSTFDTLLDYREVPEDGDYSNVAVSETPR